MAARNFKVRQLNVGSVQLKAKCGFSSAHPVSDAVKRFQFTDERHGSDWFETWLRSRWILNGTKVSKKKKRERENLKTIQ